MRRAIYLLNLVKSIFQGLKGLKYCDSEESKKNAQEQGKVISFQKKCDDDVDFLRTMFKIANEENDPVLHKVIQIMATKRGIEYSSYKNQIGD
jgi:hypothetical protein